MSPPPGDEDADRERILARRAVFVTTALAALGCSSQTPQQTPPPDASVVATTTAAPSTSAGGAPTSSANATPGQSSLRPWDAVLAEAPPLDVSASLPAADMKDLEALRERLKPTYDALGAAWKGVPTSCAPKDCRKEWSAAADAIKQAHDSIKPGLCGTWGGLGYRQRMNEHGAFIHAITKELQDGLSDAAMKLGDATTWPQMVNRPPEPQPCLKCAMPKDPGPLDGGDPTHVPFADGASALSPDAESVLAKLPADATLIIRGHADPGEKDAAKLAQARAEAVKKALVKKGAKAKNLTVLSLAADLPIASSKTDAGRAKNRRVDFAYPPEQGAR